METEHEKQEKINSTKVNPDSLPPKIRTELQKVAANQLDIMYVRHSLHNLINKFQNVSSSLELLNENYNSLKESFFVEVQANNNKNKVEKVHISEIIPKLVRETRKVRWYHKFRQLLSENKTLMYILGILGSGLLIAFRSKVIESLISMLEAIK